MPLSKEQKQQAHIYLDKLLNASKSNLNGEEFLEWAYRVYPFMRELLSANDFRVRETAQALARFNAAEFNQRAELLPKVQATLRGILHAVKADLRDGHVVNARNQGRAEVEHELLTKVHALLDLNLKDPAAMLLGAILELRLRNLCSRYGITNVESIDPMNTELSKRRHYSEVIQHDIKKWGFIRNKADHAEFDAYSFEEVEQMYNGILEFIRTYAPLENEFGSEGVRG